jgi:hypothetical protein
MAKEKSAGLSILGLALGFGICWGLWTLIAGWVAMFGWTIDFVAVMHSSYLGYEPSFIGAIIGGIWAFVHGFITGGVIAFFYNMFRR